MSLLAMTAAVTLSAANPANDPIAQDEVALGLRPPAMARRSPAQFPPPSIVSQFPGNGYDQPAAPYDDLPAGDVVEDQAYYPENYAPYPGNEEYWTYDGTGTIPLRYGVQTPDGSYEYDLQNDEITFRIRN